MSQQEAEGDAVAAAVEAFRVVAVVVAVEVVGISPVAVAFLHKAEVAEVASEVDDSVVDFRVVVGGVAEVVTSTTPISRHPF
jgi:hypothetical protein